MAGVQWSKFADQAGGIGSVRNEEGKLIPSLCGYQEQAMNVANNPGGFDLEDKLKAMKILKSMDLNGLVQKIFDAS